MMLVTIDLRVDAAAEAARLEAARALTPHTDTEHAGGHGDDDVVLAQLDGHGAWILAARSPALRRALGWRVLLLWRATWEDAGGRVVESRLVAIAVSLSPGARVRRRAHVRALVRAMEHETVGLVDRCSDEWRIAAERTTRAFAAKRAERARAIALESRDAERTLVQPGLFDRRAARPADSTNARPDPIESGPAPQDRPRLQLVVVP
jgi:hypothetical protein